MSNEVGERYPDEVLRRFGPVAPRFASAAHGTLFEGCDPASRQPVVVKFLHASSFGSPTDRQRVRRELQKLVGVRHPSLVPVLDVGDAGDFTWLVRPLIAGESLSERLAARGRLTPSEAATLGVRLAGALSELHRHGILHRDLRPGHVLLGADGDVFLVDAAVGRYFRTPEGRVLSGAPGYVPPEAIAGKLVSFRSDLYGLGAVLYESLAGIAPFMALDPLRVLQSQLVDDPEPLGDSVPEAMSSLIAQLLAREPKDRPFSAQAVERQLAPWCLPVGEDAGIEPAERTMMMDASSPSLPTFAGHEERSDEAPTRVTSALDIPLPPPVGSGSRIPRMPTIPPIVTAGGPPPGSSFAARAKSTMVGVGASNGPWGAAAEDLSHATPQPQGPPPERSGVLASPPARPGSSGLDYDDVIDTNQNEASRVFGMPEVASQGTAVPPLPRDLAEQVLAGEAVRGLPGATPSGPVSTYRGATPVPRGVEASPLRAATPAPMQRSDPYAQPPLTAQSTDVSTGVMGGYPNASPDGFNADDPPVEPTVGIYHDPSGQGGPHVGFHPPGVQPAMQQGMQHPGMQQGMQHPGMPQGMQHPGMPQGMHHPGMQQGMQHPGMPQGMPPGMQHPGMPYPGGPQGMQYPGGYGGPSGQFVAGPPGVVAAPPKRSSSKPWIGALFLVVGIAGAAGFYSARNRANPSTPDSQQEPTLTVVPPSSAGNSQPEAEAEAGTTAEPPAAPETPPAAPETPPAAPETPPAAPETPPAAPATPPAAPETPPPAPETPPAAPAPPPVVPAAPEPPPAAPVPPPAAPEPPPAPAPVRPVAAPTTPRPAPARPRPVAPSGDRVAANDPRIAAAMQARDWTRARTLIEQALRSNGSNAALHAQHGNVLDRLGGQQPAALAAYQRAVRLDRRNTRYLHRVADLQLATGQRDAAITTLRQILRINPQEPAAQHRLDGLGAAR